MKRGKAMAALISTAVILAVVLIIVGIGLFEQKKQNSEHIATIDAQEQTAAVLQDESIIELIAYAESVMRGEVIITDENDPLWIYSYSESTYPEMKTIEADLEVVSAKTEGDKGELLISYSILYLDKDGQMVRDIFVSKDLPTTWYIEKQDGKWVIFDKLSYP